MKDVLRGGAEKTILLPAETSKDPHPIYRRTFVQLKKKLLEIGVSLMSLGCCRLCAPGDIRELAQEGLMGSDATLDKD